MTSYTNARPGARLLVMDLDLGSALGLLASRCRTSPRSQLTLAVQYGEATETVRNATSGQPIQRRRRLTGKLLVVVGFGASAGGWPVRMVVSGLLTGFVTKRLRV